LEVPLSIIRILTSTYTAILPHDSDIAAAVVIKGGPVATRLSLFDVECSMFTFVICYSSFIIHSLFFFSFFFLTTHHSQLTTDLSDSSFWFLNSSLSLQASRLQSSEKFDPTNYCLLTLKRICPIHAEPVRFLASV
jgi:hypothetical protein